MARQSKHGLDDRLAQLAELLIGHGISGQLAPFVAHGILSRLKYWCWANLTDVVGDGQAVDDACGNPLPAPLVLGTLLYKSSLVGIVKGSYFFPFAYADRPTALDKMWRRKAPENYKQAKERAQINMIEKPTFTIEEEPPHDIVQGIGQLDLFGEPLVPPPNPTAIAKEDSSSVVKEKNDNENQENGNEAKRNDGAPGYTELVEYWYENWNAIVGKGKTKYPFTGIDGRYIKQILAKTENINEAKRTIDAYLADKDKFYNGKPLKFLISNLPRFKVAATSAIAGGCISRFNEIEYKDAGIKDLSTGIY